MEIDKTMKMVDCPHCNRRGKCSCPSCGAGGVEGRCKVCEGLGKALMDGVTDDSANPTPKVPRVDP